MELESFGFTKEEILDRVVDRAVSYLLKEHCSLDEDGEEVSVSGELEKKLRSAVAERVDVAVAQIADKHILPNIQQFLENLTLQKTNEWGEPKSAPLSYKEYLLQKANDYLTTQVNFDGKTKGEDGYNWRGYTTRIIYLVERHLQSQIESGMKEALATANSQIAEGIAGAVKIGLAKVLTSLKVSATVSK